MGVIKVVSAPWEAGEKETGAEVDITHNWAEAEIEALVAAQTGAMEPEVGLEAGGKDKRYLIRAPGRVLLIVVVVHAVKFGKWWRGEKDGALMEFKKSPASAETYPKAELIARGLHDLSM
jgi:hypothetical protein